MSKTNEIQLFQEEFTEEYKIIKRIREKDLTYCGYPKLENVCRAIRNIQLSSVPGIYIEAGCALGGSAILIAEMKPQSVPFYIFDVFGMIPPPSERDGIDAHNRYAEIASGKSKGLGENQYYGYIQNLQDVVQGNIENFGFNLASENINLVPGMFHETLDIQDVVAFAHIDCDWYDSVTTCIEKITPKMSIGAAIVFDDYSSYSGCKQAVDEFLSRNSRFKLVRLERSATLIKDE
ncbi:MAG: TylF/MycF family methyltransferase [Goleter apudmare HA4340-LM2]|jgi:asparagine synthase (glutamine-hydrolysing)|nr:TylF/MycF family methyltransferase [Goleter apudmare HA4340-LM2]